jgi:hypothetical protein
MIAVSLMSGIKKPVYRFASLNLVIWSFGHLVIAARCRTAHHAARASALNANDPQ